MSGWMDADADAICGWCDPWVYKMARGGIWWPGFRNEREELCTAGDSMKRAELMDKNAEAMGR